MPSTIFFAIKREDAEQGEGADQRRREDARKAADAGQLRAGIHVHDGAGEHADLADPVEGPGAHRRQAHQQVDHEEGEHRHQAQGEQVEPALLLDAGVDRAQALAEARLHPVAQQETRGKEGQRGAERRGEGHQHRAPQQAEHGAAGERHDRRTGQRQRRDGDIHDEESCATACPSPDSNCRTSKCHPVPPSVGGEHGYLTGQFRFV
jgi:hypothetical protein